MDVADVRTVRSFCRICTSVCGILVDVAGDEVVRVRGDHDHPLSHGYTCAKGRALPQLHHHPDRIERPMMRVDGVLTETTWETCLDDLGSRVRAVIETHGPVRGGSVLRERERHGRLRLPHVAGAARRARYAGQVQPAHDRRHRQGADLRSGRRFGRAERATRLRPRDVRRVLREQPRRVPRPLGRDAGSRVGHPGARDARRGVGRRSAPHRNRAPRRSPSRAPSGHRLRGARVPRARGPARRCRSCRARGAG